MSEERNEKNVIFGGSQPVEPTGVRSSMGLDIPTENIPLPSKGLLYSEGSPLHGRLNLDIRPMTTKEEDILTSRALIKKGTVITALLKSCLIDQSIRVQDMIAGDRNALMVAIRITGYGSEYSVEMTCPACSEKYKDTFLLDQMPIKWLELEPVRPGENEFAYTLPVSKMPVTFKFLTGNDEEDILARQEKMKKHSEMMGDTLVTTRLTHALLSVNGNSDPGYISKAIRSMRAGDSRALREFIDANEPGIEMRQSSTCSHCSHEEEVSVPMGVGFFWPSAVR